MASVVLDTSALLAYVSGETGADKVADVIGDAVISAVNFAEAVSVIVNRGGSIEMAESVLGLADIEVIDFDRDQATRAGGLISQTRQYGLSLGDRSCLALAIQRACPVFTADRAWSKLDLKADIQLIR